MWWGLFTSGRISSRSFSSVQSAQWCSPRRWCFRATARMWMHLIAVFLSWSCSWYSGEMRDGRGTCTQTVLANDRECALSLSHSVRPSHQRLYEDCIRKVIARPTTKLNMWLDTYTALAGLRDGTYPKTGNKIGECIELPV